MNNYEEQMSKIEGINWLPWIGQSYEESGIFVIGESHYEDGEFWQEGNKSTTRIIIKKRYDEIDGVWKFHKNVENILLNKSSNSIEEIKQTWDNIIFWNLVQRLLDNRTAENRPTFNDFTEGWQLFFKLCEIFKPKICLVLGKESRNSLGYLLANKKLGQWKLTDSTQFNQETFFTINNEINEIRILFINHPSGSYGFNYEKWANIFHSMR
jgi:hypothetical protein